MTYEERFKIVKDIIEKTDWRSDEESYDYGYGGESVPYHSRLSDYEIDPVITQILDKLGLGD